MILQGVSISTGRYKKILNILNSSFLINNSMKDHKNGKNRVCKLLEMVWTTISNFESGKKFCPTQTTGASKDCKNGFSPKKVLSIFKKTKTSTWHECRNLCNEKAKCEYFKWKVIHDRVHQR